MRSHLNRVITEGRSNLEDGVRARRDKGKGACAHFVHVLVTCDELHLLQFFLLFSLPEANGAVARARGDKVVTQGDHVAHLESAQHRSLRSLKSPTHAKERDTMNALRKETGRKERTRGQAEAERIKTLPRPPSCAQHACRKFKVEVIEGGGHTSLEWPCARPLSS